MKKFKTPIQVPETEIQNALALGAKQDLFKKTFYVPEDRLLYHFWRYIPLTIELIPASNWNNNVRSKMSRQWDDIRRGCYHKAGYRCEICGGVGEQHPVECHEEWAFDFDTRIQKLVRLIALCPLCHQAKHIGLTYVKGNEKVVKEHLKQVNEWQAEDVERAIAEAFAIFEALSQVEWTLDLSLVT